MRCFFSVRTPLILALTVLPPTGALADPVGEQVFRDLVSELDGVPGWSASVGSITSDDDIVVGTGVHFVRTEPPLDITFDELRLGQPREAAGGLSADSIQAAGLSVVGEDVAFDAPVLSMTGIAVPSLADMSFDQDRPFSSLRTLYQRLSEVSVEHAEIPEFHQVVLPRLTTVRKQSITYEGLELRDWKDGVIAHSAVGPITMRTEGDDPATARIASVRVEGTNFNSVLRLLSDDVTGSAGDAPNEWQNAVSEISYAGLSITTEEGLRVSIDDMTLSDIETRRPDKPYIATFEQAMQEADSGTDADTDDLEVMEAVTTFFDAMRLGEFKLDRLIAEKTGEEAGRTEIAEIGMSNLTRDGFERAWGTALLTDFPDAYVKLDRFALNDLVFPLPNPEAFAALEEAETGSLTEEERRAFATLPFQMAPQIGSLDMEGLAVGQSRILAISVDRIQTKSVPSDRLLPERGELKISDLSVPGALLRRDPKSALFFDGLGYDGLLIDIDGASELSEDGRLETTTALEVADAAGLRFGAKVTGLTEEWVLDLMMQQMENSDDPAALFALLSKLRLEQMTVALTDHSLIDRSFALAAEKQGQPADQYKEQIVGALPFLIASAVQPKIAQFLADPLKDFLEKGNTLVLTLAPRAPLPFSALVGAQDDPEALLKLVGASLETRETAPELPVLK
ncbi:hypothetical protein [Afifella marina]|uniref:Uncharacterized protein n=1 Tax=Afifella marina DSM 2698 TaxID=1120955 RepID=A0A1G5NI89_AFIMA|nr:hypothetical protein [Afifella marina]MBK1623553.1 hypothetical protein [Afifella marina DSM 2698]MBK1626546.1 hypothetical protein [Afifella marina]MBK5916095.1 hypothetical protein [Afifella marina]RAI21701.1 hypothetical protein CH311_06720 [Afifella marina DSM 2698]SCZ37117.1 hypothetical protein SAMN03080610_02098 [Afifella marina DSM 2698]